MDYSVSAWKCDRCSIGPTEAVADCPLGANAIGECQRVYITNIRKELKYTPGSFVHLQLDPNEHITKHLNLTTISANNHCLSITDADGKTQVFYISVQQVLHLAYQAIQSLWTFYKIVPK